MRAKPKKIYFNTVDVAEMLGISRRSACYWLKREGAAIKRGAHYYTTIDRLMVAFPDAFQAFAKE